MQGQKSGISILAKTLIEECPKFATSKPKFCGKVDLNDLEQRLNKADQHLRERVKSLVIADSTSTFYEEQKKVLANLEVKKKASKTSRESLQEQIENQYLFLALLSPRKSEKYFDKIASAYFGNNNLLPTCLGNKSPQAEPESCICSDSFLQFQFWLYQILDERFHDETTSYGKYNAIKCYNWIISKINSPFEGDVNNEYELIELIKTYAPVALSGKHLNSYSSENEFIADALRVRSSTIRRGKQLIEDHEVFILMEELLTQSLAYNNDPSTQYSLGVHYFNYSIVLQEKLDIAETQPGIDDIEAAIEKYREMGLDLVNKSRPALDQSKPAEDEIPYGQDYYD